MRVKGKQMALLNGQVPLPLPATEDISKGVQLN